MRIALPVVIFFLLSFAASAQSTVSLNITLSDLQSVKIGNSVVPDNKIDKAVTPKKVEAGIALQILNSVTHEIKTVETIFQSNTLEISGQIPPSSQATSPSGFMNAALVQNGRSKSVPHLIYEFNPR